MFCSACRSAYNRSKQELLLLVYALEDADADNLLEKVDAEDHEAVLKMIAERSDHDSLQIAATSWKCCFKDMKAEEKEWYEAESTDDSKGEEDEQVGDTIDIDALRIVDDNDNADDGIITSLYLNEKEDVSNDGDPAFGAGHATADRVWCQEVSDEEELSRYREYSMREFIDYYHDDEPLYGGVSDDWEEYLDKIGHDKSYD